jgi:hypothetical protein
MIAHGSVPMARVSRPSARLAVCSSGAGRPAASDHRGDPGKQPAATDRNQDGLHSFDLRENLQAGRALACNDVGVVEGRDHRQTLIGGEPLRHPLLFGGTHSPGEDDFTTPLADPGDLHRSG